MNSQEEKILADLSSLKPQLKEWGEYVDAILISDILLSFFDKNVIKIQPSYRIKDDISYLIKALYRKKPYKNPLEDIEDKIGTRIVVLKSSDVEEVAQKILDSNNWEAKKTKSVKQEIEDKPSIFDYQSIHIVVRPIEGDRQYSTPGRQYFTCEIQIRTLLQHAFAEVSHDSTYKGPYKNDKGILRHLAKSMALMEATDDYFCKIFELMSDEKRYYRQYTSELIALYQSFVPTFDIRTLNYDVTDKIFELLVLHRVEVQDVTVYVEKNKAELKKVIKPENGFLFQQPISILINYFFQYHRTILNENWPLGLESLKSVYTANNTSFENY